VTTLSDELEKAIRAEAITSLTNNPDVRLQIGRAAINKMLAMLAEVKP
jgi:hypothetical protein